MTGKSKPTGSGSQPGSAAWAKSWITVAGVGMPSSAHTSWNSALSEIRSMSAASANGTT